MISINIGAEMLTSRFLHVQKQNACIHPLHPESWVTDRKSLHCDSGHLPDQRLGLIVCIRIAPPYSYSGACVIASRIVWPDPTQPSHTTQAFAGWLGISGCRTSCDIL